MATRTYPQLGTFAAVQDGDLIAGWRSSGPLKTYTALMFKTYLGGAYLPLAGGTMTGVLKITDGSSGTPAFSFASEATTGVYRSAAGNWDVAILGTRRINLSATGLNVYGACAAVSFAGPLTGNVTGNLTGNVTGNVTGNASTATAWAAGRTLSLTGDVTYTSPSIDGTGNVTAAATLATTQSAAHTWSALQTLSAGANMTPATTPATNAVGYLGSPLNNQSGDYTLVMSDFGKTISYTGSGGNTFTIPANASVAFADGAPIVIANEGSGNLTIAITSDTLKWLGNTGSRTLSAGGTSTIQKKSSTVWRITGDLLA